MARHGDLSFSSLIGDSQPSFFGSRLPRAGSGFRHMLREAFAADGDGADIGGQPKPMVSRITLGKLSRVLHRDWRRRENPGIPAGYTYFWQFVAHDLVQSTISLAQAAGRGYRIDNSRSEPLSLQTIYGNGPENSALLYQFQAAGEPIKTSSLPVFLRLGALKAGPARLTCPFRDIARHNLAEMKDASLPDLLVADPRNDDQTILAQLSAVFHLLHNGIVVRQEKSRHSAGDACSIEQSAETGFAELHGRYAAARLAVQALYRRAIHRDLMPHLLMAEVHDLYAKQQGPIVEKADGTVSFEFSHAVARVAHVMIREEYRLGDGNPFPIHILLERTSARNPRDVPVDTNWAVSWSNFFRIGGIDAEPSASMQIGPAYPNLLTSDTLFPPVDGQGIGNLAYRDLLSASWARLWKVGPLIRELSASNDDLAAILRGGEDPCFRSKIADWLGSEENKPFAKFSQKEIEALAEDPPLPFFLMFEAWADERTRGRRLGPLGSIIAAEAVYGALAETRLFEDELSLTMTGLQSAIDKQIGRTVMADMPPPEEGVGGLIKLASELSGLWGAEPSFL